MGIAKIKYEIYLAAFSEKTKYVSKDTKWYKKIWHIRMLDKI